MNTTLEQAPVLHLLIELIKDGNARIIPELAPLEPIEIDAIVAVLSEKVGVNHGRDVGAWCRWFTEDYGEAEESDRQSLVLIKEMVENQRYYLGRLTRKGSKSELVAPENGADSE